MVVVENLIRSCWEHYAFEDAVTLSEIYFAERRSNRAAFLLATSYFRSGQYSSTYEFLKNFGVRGSETKFLFAKCCEKLNKLPEAEETLVDLEGQSVLVGSKSSDASFENEFGSTASFAHALLGRIYSKTNRSTQAISEHRSALSKLPALLESYKSLCNLGADDDAAQYFGSAAISILPATKMAEEWITPTFAAPVSKTVSFAGIPRVETLDVFMSTVDTPPLQIPPSNEKSSASSNCKTPYFGTNPSVPEPKMVPKAPTKNPRTRDSSHSTNRIVTRQQSQRVLTQNQSKIATRRSTRLFPSSVKENENEMGSMRNEKISTAKISVARRAARSRKTDLEKLATNNELNKAKMTSQALENNEKSTSGGITMDKAKKDDAGLSPEDYQFFENLRKFAQIESSLSRYDCPAVIALVDNLSDHHRSSPLGLLAKARAYFEQANYHKADEYFREIRRKYGYFVKGMEYYSTALWHLQKDMDLSALAQELTEQHKFAPESWCTAGNCFSLQKDNDTAIRFFQRAIQLNQDFAYAYTLLGHEYVAVESYEHAQQCFRVALSLQPKHYNAWYGLGLIYYKQEKLGLASLHLRRALDINPRNSVLMCHVSLVLQGLDDRNGAMKLLDEALSLSPRNALCRYHRAHLLFAQERHSEALDELKELKQLAPKEPLVYFLAGKVYKKMGEPHLALMNFSWATELDPRGEQNHPIVGDRRYDEEPVTALAAMEPDEMNETQAMDSDDSA